MKKIWNGWLKECVFIYSVVYTIATVANSAAYLTQGIREDPSGNWHELTRAMIVFIGVIAFALAKHLPVKNMFLRIAITYAITLPCVFLVVWSTQFIEPLAASAYRDVFVNYTGLFFIVSIAVVVIQTVRRHRQAG